MVNVLVSEIRKNKRSKALAISALLIVVYEAITVFYTVRAVGLFDNFMYLYKFALSYMDFLILPMILLSFITAIFSTDYKSDTIKYLWTIPVSKKTVFLCESRICVIAGMYVYDSGVCHHLRCGILQPVSIRYDGGTRFTVLFAVCFKFSLCNTGYAACFAYHRFYKGEYRYHEFSGKYICNRFFFIHEIFARDQPIGKCAAYYLV